MSQITLTLLKRLFPGTPDSKLNRFVVPFNTILPKYEINNKKRFSAFIANVGIESDHLKALEEYASGDAYDTRTSLGNTPERDGDGRLYKGRSVLQTTGKYNYWKVVIAYLRVLTGKNWDNKLAHSDFQKYTKSKEYADLLKEADKYNVNFLAHPEMLEQFPHAVEASGVFVKDNNLNDYADRGQFYAYAGILNKGSAKKKALAYNERKALYDLAMNILPENFTLDNVSAPEPKSETNDAVTVTNADSVVVNEAGVSSQETGSVSVSVGNNGDVKVDTTTGAPPAKEKLAVVGAKPVGFFSGLGAKITGLITGNALFTWFMDQLEKLQAIALSPVTWKIIIGLVLLGSLIWIADQVMDNRAARKKQKEMEQLLVEQNSTPDNLISVVPYEDAELFKLKGYKLIRSGSSLTGDAPPENQ